MRKTLVLIAVLLATSLVACGGDDGSGDAPNAAPPNGSAGAGQGPLTQSDLDGQTFTASDGKGIEITEEYPLELEFDGRRLSVDAGCNSISGNYSLEKSEIQAFLVSTLMGCPPVEAELEVFISELLRQGAVARLSGDKLSLDGKNGNSLTLTR
jgi:heat shock protein HslJ